MTYKEFSQIADKLTTSSETTLPGLVNVNTAPKEVLLCLPGLEESDADALVSYRKPTQRRRGAQLDRLGDTGPRSGEGDRNRQLHHRSLVSVLRGHRLPVRQRPGLQAVPGDPRHAGTPPRVVYWRSLTHFGWPLQPEIVAALKKGQPLTRRCLEQTLTGREHGWHTPHIGTGYR